MIRLYDTFTDASDTLLENHTGETGATWTNHSVSIKTKAGPPTDADINVDRDGTMVLDTTNHRLYVRSGGVWRYSALT